MKIEIIDSLDAMERLRPEWLQLFLRCPRATPFQSPQWLLAWTKHLFRGGEILGITMRSQGELIGFAPLFCWGTDRRTVSFLGAGISDYGDLLFAPGWESECVSAIWPLLDGRTLDLQEIRCGSGLLKGQRIAKCSVCPVLDLRGYPREMDPKLRTDVRRSQNKLRRSSQPHFSMASRRDLACEMDGFLALYRARWGAMDEALQQFHQDVAADFISAGLLRLGLLRIDDAVAAAVYAFRTGKKLYCYLSGFDPALAKLSPGAVLLEWMIEQAQAEQIEEVDFLRHQEAYKYLWGAKDTFNYKIGPAATACSP